jgi:hypothetical protein
MLMIAGFALVIPAGLTLMGLNKVNPPRKFQAAMAITKMMLAFIVGVGLTATFIGHWGAGLFGWILAQLDHLGSDDSNVLQWAVPLGALGFFTIVAVADIASDHRADKGAQTAAILVPVLLTLSVGGALGAQGGEAVSTAYDQALGMFQNLGGGS